MRYLLDTSVYCQPLRRNPVQSALRHWRDAGDGACRIAAVTLGEVEFGLRLEDREVRWKKYQTLLENRLEILETTQDVWREFAGRKARQQRLGQPVADLDLLIASTAALHRLTVATLNSTDFSRIEGVSWEDWSR